jgi:hypothetical protein
MGLREEARKPVIGRKGEKEKRKKMMKIAFLLSFSPFRLFAFYP